MKSLNNKFLFILLMTINFLFANYACKSQDEIKIKAYNFPDQKNTSEYTNIGVELFNSSVKTIKIPSFRRIGIKNDPYADLVIELRKCIGDTVFVPVELSDEYLPAIEHASIVEFSSNNKFVDTINYALYYRFTIGRYQGRVMFKAAKYNSDIENLYSNWVEFKVSEAIPLKTYKPRIQ